MDPTKLLADASYEITGPGISPAGDSTQTAELIISNVIGIITIVGVLYFIFQLMIAGFAFITTEGDKGKMEAARKRITESIMGLVVIIIALGVGALVATIFGIDSPLNFELMFTKMGLPPL